MSNAAEAILERIRDLNPADQKAIAEEVVRLVGKEQQGLLPSNSLRDIVPSDLGSELRPLSADDDLLAEMLER